MSQSGLDRELASALAEVTGHRSAGSGTGSTST